MSGGIFVIQSDGKLADYPDLLAGGQVDPESPRRWLLVTREAGVPDEEGGATRWSVDHLFLDQDGIPTLIEVKRSSDTRIRREVVGQMLDYAANCVVYWPVETIRSQFEATCVRLGKEPESVLANLLGPGGDPAQFWANVGENLQLGRIRLIFVADEIRASCGGWWSSSTARPWRPRCWRSRSGSSRARGFGPSSLG